MSIHRKFVDLEGQTFGHYKVLRYTGRYRSNGTEWECRCLKCGNVKKVAYSSLVFGHSTQCISCSKIKHGLSGTREYKSHSARNYREKKRLLDVEWTLDMELFLREIFPSCVVCGNTNQLAVDHVFPLSKGYGLKPGNAVVLCKLCNSSKINKDIHSLPIDWQVKILISAEIFRMEWEFENSNFS